MSNSHWTWSMGHTLMALTVISAHSVVKQHFKRVKTEKKTYEIIKSKQRTFSAVTN